MKTTIYVNSRLIDNFLMGNPSQIIVWIKPQGQQGEIAIEIDLKEYRLIVSENAGFLEKRNHKIP